VSVLVAGPEAVDACLDKLRFAATLRAAGEPAIPTTTSPAPEAGRHVVKERFGAGGRSVGLALGPAEAEAHAARLREPVFQPYVEGDEYSVDLFASPAGELRGVVARRRETVIGGESQVTATVRDPALESLCARVAGLLGVTGHAVVQVLVDAHGRRHVVECNPRFGGASTLAVAAGLDTFAWAYLEALGEDPGTRPFRRCTCELRQVRAPADHRFAVELVP
jgi:carbamoyl-phosphate synthase large subunit